MHRALPSAKEAHPHRLSCIVPCYCSPSLAFRHLALRVMVLALFVVSQTPVLPVMSAMAVWLDGSHQVEFSSGEEGVTLLLRHQRKQGQDASALPLGHQHGLLTRAVLSFAQSQGGVHPDHKLSFKSAKDGYERASYMQRAASKPLVMPVHSELASVWMLVPPHLARLHRWVPPAVDDVAASDCIGLRTTVMLI